MKKIECLADLTPDPRNLNRGTKRGVDLLDQSLERCGAGRSIVVDKNGLVIAGNHTLERAVEKGFQIQVVKTDGRQLVVVQREDLDLEAMDDPRARELAIADNRTSEIGLDWDPMALLEDAPGVELGTYFFEEELNELKVKAAQEHIAGESDGQLGAPRTADGRKTVCPNCQFEF